MTALYVTLGVVAWLAIGFLCMVWLVTKDDDFTANEIMLGLWGALGGPAMLVVVLMVESLDWYTDKEIVIFRKRK